jgi:hypothetical protein
MYRPWTNRYLGVEMETRTRTTEGTALSERMLRRAVSRAATSPMGDGSGWFRSDGRTWDVKTDSSCGWEIASPKLMLDDAGHNAELRGVCSNLAALNPVVDQACGLHVHVDCSDFNWRDLQRLLALWTRYEPFFFELMPRSRRRCNYAEPLFRNCWSSEADRYRHGGRVLDACLATTEMNFNSHAQGLNRTNALNVTGWWRHLRVEFRLHSGTVNYDKVRAWAMLCLAMVQRVKEGEMPDIQPLSEFGSVRPFSTSYICKVLGLLPSSLRNDVPPESIRLAAWLDRRRRQFTPELAQPASPVPVPELAPEPVPVPVPEPEFEWMVLDECHRIRNPQGYARWPGTSRRLRSQEGENTEDRALCVADVPGRCSAWRMRGFRTCPTHHVDYAERLDFRVLPDQWERFCVERRLREATL